MTLGLLAVAMLLGGCVWPGPVDPAVVARYQRALAERGPQRRVSAEGLGLLQPAPPPIGPKLKVQTDPETGKVRADLSLEEAIQRALAGSAEIRVVSFDPAISREEIERAAAEFDYILFGGYGYEQQDLKVASRLPGGQADIRTLTFGVKEKAVTGAQWSLAWTTSRTWDNSLFNRFTSRYESKLEAQVTQPLLRDAWPEFNLARLRVARLNHKITLAQFRQKVEEVVTQVVSIYLQLIQARRDVEIQQELLDKTEETLRRVTERYKAGLDVTAVQVKQAEAAVEARRAVLIRARKTVLDVQDALVRLLADPELNLAAIVEITPTTVPSDVAVRLEPVDQLLTSLQYNPALEQARLAIEAAEINVRVTENQKLPKLDLTASAGYQGLHGTLRDSFDSFMAGDHGSASVGVTGEYPLGNRQRLAEYRIARHERAKAVATLQNTADEVAQAIRERLRQISTTFDELQAQRAAVEAAKVQLQALEDTERIRGRLTPEFLQVKLQAQETLANAERAEVQALVNYNSALVELERVKGTVLELNGVKLALPYVLEDRPAPAPPVKKWYMLDFP